MAQCISLRINRRLSAHAEAPPIHQPTTVFRAGTIGSEFNLWCFLEYIISSEGLPPKTKVVNLKSSDLTRNANLLL